MKRKKTLNPQPENMDKIIALNAAAGSLNTLMEPESLYRAIVQQSSSLAGAERSSLMLPAKKNTSTLVIRAAKGMDKNLSRLVKVKKGEGIAGKVFKNGTTVLVSEVGEKEKISVSRKSAYKTASFVSIPLKIGERTIGVLNVSDKITGEVFTEEDLTLLRSFASYASVTIELLNYQLLTEQLRELSITDPLTGLFNRRYFEERFIEELHRSKRHNLSFSLAMMDIDDFKLFNDTEGHVAGDQILKKIAQIERKHLRITDILARIGGEEFALLMPQTEREEAWGVSERIRKGFMELTRHRWKKYPKKNLSLSMGVAVFPGQGKSLKELMTCADKALYQAKTEGKNKTVI
jgi:diguanylate cyclase (GGDEF)-like protein